jgi:hypothetical protein
LFLFFKEKEPKELSEKMLRVFGRAAAQMQTLLARFGCEGNAILLFLFAAKLLTTASGQRKGLLKFRMSKRDWEKW